MRFYVDSRIRVEEPNKAVIDYCKTHLVLDNPDYYKKERLGKWTGNTPRSIALYERDGDDVILPFGCLRDMWSLCPDASAFKVSIRAIEPIQYQSSINLYPYQERAVKAATEGKNGILVMPCGSGKTQCGLEIISRIGGRALWLTHTQDLLNQSRKRAETVLGKRSGEYGSITAGKVDIGTHITFATVQTMSKLILTEFADVWDIIIVDECQHCCGSPTKVTQFYKVVSQLSARYKIGLTATPKRSDGLERSMFALLGGKICEISREEVAHTTCPIKVQQIDTGWMPDFECVLMGDGTIDYSKVVDNLTHNDQRFALVSSVIAELGHSRVMVLANRVEYLQKLCAAYNADHTKFGTCLSGQGQSKAAKAERKAALEALDAGEIDAIFATYQLAKEGLDVPQLRYVVFATPEQDETTVIQSVGRVGRKADGKEYGTVIDFVDDFGMYQGWSKKRVRYYKKIGAEVIE